MREWSKGAGESERDRSYVACIDNTRESPDSTSNVCLFVPVILFVVHIDGAQLLVSFISCHWWKSTWYACAMSFKTLHCREIHSNWQGVSARCTQAENIIEIKTHKSEIMCKYFPWNIYFYYIIHGRHKATCILNNVFSNECGSRLAPLLLLFVKRAPIHFIWQSTSKCAKLDHEILLSFLFAAKQKQLPNQIWHTMMNRAIDLWQLYFYIYGGQLL